VTDLQHHTSDETVEVQELDVATLDHHFVWHPYTQHYDAPEPPEIVRASGAQLFTRDGQSIIDAISSWWVTLHGHSNSVIAAAIARQARELEQVIFAGFTHEPAARLAGELVACLPPGLTRVFYSDNGSTAVEVAVKMAVQFWANMGEKRKLIIALEHAYHGDTFGAMSVSAPTVFTDAFGGLLFEVVRIPAPGLSHLVGTQRSTDDSSVIEAFEALVTEREGEIAAIIVEPMLMGAGGMRTWSAETLLTLRERAAAAGILFIVDEVLTGFGRTGPLFACEHAGAWPDIICLSKGLTGGFMPLGATVATKVVFDGFLSEDRSHTLFHGHSYTANPLACAAARASLSVLDSGSRSDRLRIEAGHRDGLSLLQTTGRVEDSRLLGTVAAFELKSEVGGYLDPAGRSLAAEALARGVLIRPLGNTVYVLPPYCISEEELETVYGVIHDLLTE
jgi:adenosylmethionine---8-amino-7-oxononanoate aminotransferase